MGRASVNATFEAVGIDTAGERREVNADGSRSEPTCENAPMARRTIGRACGKEKPTVSMGCNLWWRRWESNPRPRNSGRRFLRVQPASLSRHVVS